MKMISYLKRNSVLPRRQKMSHLTSPYKVMSSQSVVQNGRVVRNSTVVEVDPNTYFDGVRVSDFDVNNLVAVGALNSMPQNVTLKPSSMSVADSIDDAISDIDFAVSESQSNVEPSKSV